MESFEAIFAEQYDTIHRLETNKLRNVARLFAHLLYTDSVPWSVRAHTHLHGGSSRSFLCLNLLFSVFNQVLECIKMSEETTTSSSRIFVKILFQELCAYMGLPKLNQRLKDTQALMRSPFFYKLNIFTEARATDWRAKVWPGHPHNPERNTASQEKQMQFYLAKSIEVTILIIHYKKVQVFKYNV